MAANMAAILKIAADKILVVRIPMGFLILHTASSRYWLRAHKLIFFKIAANMAAISKMATEKIRFFAF